MLKIEHRPARRLSDAHLQLPSGSWTPEWHGEVLRERDKWIAEGKESSTDWETAKRNLRERLR